MHIKRITTHRWKGRSLAVDLTSACVISGPSYSGKTSIPMAIRLALAGYLPPPIGKLPGSIWQLASNPEQPGECSVALTLDDGSQNGRVCGVVLERTVKGKVSMKGNVPADIALPSLLVEPSTFFTLTGAQRISAVFAACDKTMIGNVADDLGAKLAGIETLPSDIAGEYIAKAQAVVSRAWQDSRENPAMMLASVRDIFDNEAKTAKSTAEMTANELAGLRSQAGDKPKFDQAEWNRLEDEYRVLRSTAPSTEARDRAVGAALAAEAASEKAQDVMTSAEHEVNQIETMECCPTCQAKTKGWRMKIEVAAQHAFKTAKAEYEAAQKQWREAAAAAETARKAFAASLAEHEAKIAAVLAARTPLSEARGALAQWEQTQARRKSIEKEVIRHTVAAEVWKQAKALTDEVRAKATERAVGNVIATANKLCINLLNSPLEFTNGELGRRVSESDIDMGSDAEVGSWISHEGFSGTEQLLAYAAFAVALTQTAGFKLVVMDELGRMDNAVRDDLLHRMAELLQKGVIDQFIGIMAKDNNTGRLEVTPL